MTTHAQAPRTSEQTSSALPGGPRLLLALSAVLLVCMAVPLALWGVGEDGVRSVIRISARTSLLLFLTAYVTSAALRLRPAASTRWLMKNRRWIGLSFAVSHAMHLAAIIALTQVAADFKLATPTLIGGGLAYVFIALMSATSNDAAVRWLGSKNWQRLHRSGMHYIWFIFAISYGPRAAKGSLFYSLLTAALIAALALRIGSRRAKRRTVVSNERAAA